LTVGLALVRFGARVMVSDAVGKLVDSGPCPAAQVSK
jgi:hypothetical protein